MAENSSSSSSSSNSSSVIFVLIYFFSFSFSFSFASYLVSFKFYQTCWGRRVDDLPKYRLPLVTDSTPYGRSTRKRRIVR